MKDPATRSIVWSLVLLMLFPFGAVEAYARAATLPYAPTEQSPENPKQKGVNERSGETKKSNGTPAVTPEHSTEAVPQDSSVYLDAEMLVKLPVHSAPNDRVSLSTDSLYIVDNDTVQTVVVDENSPYGLDGKIPFNPDPTRAVWMSALFPGLGQVYNRRYWKLPIVVAGFMGLGYGTAWNNNQLTDYTQAYRDLLDNDPASNSYMNFFPPTTSESDLDKTWLTSTMKSRRDYYRRNRDLCIICLVGLYLLCMVDAYVDASLSHFDISPGLAMDMAPALLIPETPSGRKVSLGLNWALTF